MPTWHHPARQCRCFPLSPKTDMTKRLTSNAAAAQTRAEILRHIKRMHTWKKWSNATKTEVLDEICGWIRDMPERAGKKTGGLGKH